jgi:Tfp pilus assembly protein PilV
MKWQNKRKAFSMLVAIIVIVLMSSVALLILSISGKVVKETTAQYQREQAMLLAKSYTEFAIMAVSANDRSIKCLNDIDGGFGSDPTITNYRVRVRLAYIGNSGVNSCSSSRVLSNSVINTDSPLHILVDVYVEYRDPDHPNPSNSPWITYHKRTLQKI